MKSPDAVFSLDRCPVSSRRVHLMKLFPLRRFSADKCSDASISASCAGCKDVSSILSSRLLLHCVLAIPHLVYFSVVSVGNPCGRAVLSCLFCREHAAILTAGSVYQQLQDTFTTSEKGDA